MSGCGESELKKEIQQKNSFFLPIKKCDSCIMRKAECAAVLRYLAAANCGKHQIEESSQ